MIAGTKRPPWMQTAMRQLATAIPGVEHHELPGQTHIVKAAALAPVLARFLK